MRVHGDTKTERSERTLALPEFVADTLREHRACQAAEQLRAGPGWKEHDLVFASTIGIPRSAGNVRRDFQGHPAQGDPALGTPPVPCRAYAHGPKGDNLQ